MATKVLIQTLSEVPDMDLLVELFTIIKKTDSLIIPDVRKFFIMISNLYQCHNPSILLIVFQLHHHINNIMISTQIEISWQHVGKSLVLLCGQQHSQIRKKARNIIIEIMNKTNNSYMILEKLFYQGIQDQSVIVGVYALKMIYNVLERTTNILQRKSSINIAKLIIEKIIRLTSSNHMDLSKNANHFLHRLFFLKMDKMEELLQRLEPFYLKSLQKIWQKNKQSMLYKNQTIQQQQQERLKQIKYQHLPIINQCIFGVYQPFIIKNLFNPSNPSSKLFAIKELKQKFLQNQIILTKYINSICKILLKLLPQKHLQVLELLSHVVGIPGITNIVNVRDLSEELIAQLDTENVTYRRLLRDVIKKFHFGGISNDIFIKAYQKALDNDGQPIQQWIKIFQILGLIQHWIVNNDVVKCYPPTLDFVVKYTSNNVSHKVLKVKSQAQKLLFFILQKFSGYRQNLEQYFDAKTVAHFQDLLQQRKAYRLPNDKNSNEAKQTFTKQYEQERTRFLLSQKNKK